MFLYILEMKYIVIFFIDLLAIENNKFRIFTFQNIIKVI